jgi:hypothetical protein
MREKKKRAPLISIVGIDGSGKTTISRWLQRELSSQGLKTVTVWSRFRNYLSKPLLAISRLSGHNYYSQYDGILFGHHNFEGLPVYRELFAVLQTIDVNIAAYWRIHRQRCIADAVICERGPWDTLVDVASETGLEWVVDSPFAQAFGFLMRHHTRVLLISRSIENIFAERPELRHDHKIVRRMHFYLKLANNRNWSVIDNNGSIEMTKDHIRKEIGLA